MLERQQALGVVLGCLRTVLEEAGGDLAGLGEETTLVGPGAAVDSIGMVSLIVDIEQRLELDHQVSVTLASERAMSQKSSPFRTAGLLADHILATEREGLAP
jgi:acyl carrier protein